MKILLLLCALLPLTLAAGDRTAERARFKQLYSAAMRNEPLAAAQLRTLRAYPLYPYLEYPQLQARLASLPVSDLKKFFATYPDSLLTARLRTAWLRELARRGRWDLFADDYAPQTDPELQCDALAIELRASPGPPSQRLKPVLAMWDSGKAAPATCEPVFTLLRTQGVLTDARVWDRIVLAAQAGNPTLAQDIARRYAARQDQSYTALLVRALGTPGNVLVQKGLGQDSARVRAILGGAVARLARYDLPRALQVWRTAQQRYHFTVLESGPVQRAIALVAVAKEDKRRLDTLAAVPASAVDARIEQGRLREGLRARDWQKLALWTRGEPQGVLTNPLRWRYWHARALEELGRHAAAKKILVRLAKERDYYGFLASDKLGVQYTITDRPVAPGHTELASIAAQPGMKRAAEFFQLGLHGQARDEWNFTLATRTKRELEVAAKLAYDWGWYDRAITVLGQIPSYDDLDLRFPVLHKDLVLRYAKQRALSPALVYSIIRGESAFVTDARSPVGALGLMQLMPLTGEITAKSLGVELTTPDELTLPDKNIAIGSEYLRQVLHQFGGSFPLAAAAYNAGPRRVRQWLANSKCVPADVWVEIIPFAETEAYVRRALFYAAIYEWRLGETVNTLASRMTGFNTHAGGTLEC